MIRLVIIAAATFVLGIAAFAGVHQYTSADASDNVTPHDADVDWSGNVDLRDALASLSQFGALAVGGRPVSETNVDANGSIRVAQQGVVDVNVVSHPSGLNLRLLYEQSGGVVPYCFSEVCFLQTPLVDVSGCTEFQVHIKGVSSSGAIYARLTLSADGVAIDGLAGGESGFDQGGGYRSGSSWNAIKHIEAVTNWAAVYLTAGNGNSNPFGGLAFYCEQE